MNFKISDIEVGDKILVKQLKLKKLTLYKSQPFTVTEKKGIIGKIRLWERTVSKCSRLALFFGKV